MNHKFRSFIRPLLCAALALGACLAIAPAARAADLTYTTPIATTDSDLVVAHKQAAALVQGNSFSNIVSNATTAVKSGSGVLDKITINTAGSAWVLTIYDNTAASGTKIATMSGNAQTTLHFNVRFATGLTIVTSGTLGSGDATVSYR